MVQVGDLDMMVHVLEEIFLDRVLDLFPDNVGLFLDNEDHALVGMMGTGHVVDTMGMDHVAGMMDMMVGNLGTKDKKDTLDTTVVLDQMGMNLILPHTEHCNRDHVIDSQKVFSDSHT